MDRWGGHVLVAKLYCRLNVLLKIMIHTLLHLEAKCIMVQNPWERIHCFNCGWGEEARGFCLLYIEKYILPLPHTLWILFSWRYWNFPSEKRKGYLEFRISIFHGISRIVGALRCFLVFLELPCISSSFGILLAIFGLFSYSIAKWLYPTYKTWKKLRAII